MPETMTGRGPLRKSVKTTAHYDRIAIRHGQATVLTVAPNVYADAADDAAVRGLLARLTAGEVDAIAFTSSPQVERLFAVAPAAAVSGALGHTLVTAVGPVVAQALTRQASMHASRRSNPFS